MTGYRYGFGPVSVELLRRCHESSANMVAVKDYREMRAARKLARRGFLVQFGTLPFFTLPEEFGHE